MIINILKSIRNVLILFATIFVINKSLIYLEIKTIEYIKIPILLYLLIFIVSFLNLQSKEKKNRPKSNETLFGLGLGALIIATGFVTLVSIREINWLGLKLEVDNIFLGFGLFVLVALAEELLLRGYVLNNLMKSMNRLIALAVSAVMFSLIHVFNSNFSWIGFWNLLLAGILLGLPYIYTKSLWFPIALHFSWNFFQGIIFGFNVSGHVTYSLFTQSRTADTIWNGGKFGFEGSVLSLVFQIIAILALWWYYSKRSEQNQLSCVPLTDQPLVENQVD